MEINRIYNGDCLEVLKTLPDESIDMVMTSPPYWALRDYGIDGQLGLEPTFQEYINKLCDIFDEVKRVLKPEGTCWVNLGDTYSGAGAGQKDTGKATIRSQDFRKTPTKTNLPDKCLIQIPQRFSIEMCNRGWILRNTIIWHKSNAMPSSVKDRFTVDFEYIFFFSKQKKYYFEQQFEEFKLRSDIEYRSSLRRKNSNFYKLKKPYKNNYPKKFNMNGRNKRTMWSIPTRPFKEAHFAVYPEELCETPIRSGCPEFVCKKCGKAREKIFDSKLVPTAKACKRNVVNKRDLIADKQDQGSNRKKSGHIPGLRRVDTFREWKDCNCSAGFKNGVVLDPFFGAGTTGLVALKNNRKFIGIELSGEYIKIAEKRLKPYLEQERLCQ